MAPSNAGDATAVWQAGVALPGLTSFGAIMRENDLIWPLAAGDISIKTDFFRDLLRIALGNVLVDDRYYCHLYPDVEKALEQGEFTSPRHHFVEFGYFEDRLPSRIEVDDEFYLRIYPDVEASLRIGLIPSAQAHFELSGYKEGRLPRENWSLLAG